MNREEFVDRLLLAYAAGGLAAPEALVAAALLALNARARARVAQFEALGGRVIEEEKPVDLREACFRSVMDRIEGRAPAPPPAAAPVRAAPEMPEPLRTLLCACAAFDTGCWSPGEGIEHMELRPRGGGAGRLFLMRMPPGARAEPHRHLAPEVTLVLEGGYTDEFGRYGRGDISVIADPRAAHGPVAGPGGCLCLVLRQGLAQAVRARRRFFFFIARG